MTEFIQVPVPPHRVPDVYKLLAEDDDAPTLGPADEYDDILIQRLFDESQEPVQRILKHLMCHPGQLIPPEDMMERAGVDDGHQLGGILGALSKRCQSRYKRSLPFEIRVIGDRSFYVMPPEIAAMVQRAR